MDVITATNEFLSEQLELFEENGIYLDEIFEWEGWEFPGKDEFDLFVRELDEYTDGQIMVSSWQWPLAGFEPGDSAGICIDQQV